MDEQQWEYCELNCGDTKDVKGKGNLYEVWIRYMSKDVPVVILADLKGEKAKVFTYPPFRYAVSILGQYGWEMISFQEKYVNGNYWEITAWFKRPIQAGRPIDFPHLEGLVLPG